MESLKKFFWEIILFTFHLYFATALDTRNVFQNLHQMMTKEELGKYFAVDKHEEVPKYEVVNIHMRKRSLPARGGSLNKRSQRSEDEDLLIYSESIFGQNIQMELIKNRQLTSPSFTAVKMEDDDAETDITPAAESCHYLGYNGSTVAAVSRCVFDGIGGLRGILMLPSHAVHLQPISGKLGKIIMNQGSSPPVADGTQEEIIPHIVTIPKMSKRLSVHDETEEWDDENLLPSYPRDEYELEDNDIKHFDSDFDYLNTIPDGDKTKEEFRKRGGDSKDLYLELAVFFDQKAYEMFMPHMKSEDNLLNLILGFVNQMQALYHQPSLQRKLHISLVRLEIMKKQPNDLPHADGERDKLLDSFCKYQEKKNPGTDKDPKHWDLALYVSGLNFFAMENGKKSGITMGLAPVGGVCMKQHACVIAEFGTVSDDGKPYPSAGLLSTYVAVHEIGHNLGMFHDGPPNNKCPPNGHVMSPSRGTKGETTWSTCSADVLKKFSKKCLSDLPQAPSKDQDHSKFKGKPGQEWDANDQCRIFLRDEDASLLNDTVIKMVCEQTLCKTSNRIGYYAAGPALEGTFCGGNKWCKQGKCVPWGSEKPKVVKGGWSEWKNGKCEAGCIDRSKGVQMDKRSCNNPKPRNTEKSCEGDNVRIYFCDDSKLCKGYQKPEAFANQRCAHFSKYVSDITPVGVQVKYNEKRQWQACAVYCKMKSGTWYTPRQELNDLSIDTFFPDGTWCHNNGKTDFYCQNHLCLPPAPKGRSLDTVPHFGPKGKSAEIDVPLLNNADPRGDNSAPEKLREYFQYVEGKNPPPLPGPDELRRPREEDYEIIDYISPSDG